MTREPGELRKCRSARAGRFSISSVLLSAFLAGCAPTHPPANKPVPLPATASVQTDAANPLESTDPCAAHMHDISGAMLMCYAVNHRLPERLQDLSTYADADQTLDFTCPVSRQPYVYLPDGIPSPGSDRRLVLYDALPVHNHLRWAILMRPATASQSAAAWVVQIPESVLQGYLTAAIHPVP
ncbi:MAG: hypothetical protein JWP03_3554 [Phycisphaerales bacterium]|jgi:hypothetical protein|nr:hypothetical protein [Phycisphaerales bacterium]